MDMEFNIKSDAEILKAFDKGLPEFKWFIEFYFKPNVLIQVLRARKKEQVIELRNLLNMIWYALPDSQFNIIENPKGWKEFLNVIED